MSIHKFWEDGLLLPFGHDIGAYTEPNPYVEIQRDIIIASTDLSSMIQDLLSDY